MDTLKKIESLKQDSGWSITATGSSFDPGRAFEWAFAVSVRACAPSILLLGYFHHTREPSEIKAYDLLLSPSFLNASMIFSISFLPAPASIVFPLMLILIFCLESASSSLLSSKCRIWIHTKTPQSLEFSCWGESVRSTNCNFLPSKSPSL